jgi:hypothetical protein
MGWGTFIAGRLLRRPSRKPITKRDIEAAEMLNNALNSAVNQTLNKIYNRKVKEIDEEKDVNEVYNRKEQVDHISASPLETLVGLSFLALIFLGIPFLIYKF